MKGVVLAGGTGSRLNPLTRVTNKHLLPVYDKPMVYYPIQALVNAGIHEILLVAGGNNAGDFLRLLGNGRHFGLKHLNYTFRKGKAESQRRLDWRSILPADSKSASFG
jgi:glucose-1-phosphate thymidylyltransferase